MTERSQQADDPDEEEISVTPPGRNSTWDRMKEAGVRLRAREYLKYDLAGTSRRWAEHVDGEYLAEVPIEIRSDVQALADSLRTFYSSIAPTTDRVPDLQILPKDPSEVAIQVGLEARRKRRSHKCKDSGATNKEGWDEDHIRKSGPCTAGRMCPFATGRPRLYVLE